MVGGVRIRGVDSLRAAAIDAGALLPTVEVDPVLPVPVPAVPRPVAELSDVVGNPVGGPSARSPRRPVDTTRCCSGRRAPARRCSPNGCPGCCPTSTTRPRSRSPRSGPSPDSAPRRGARSHRGKPRTTPRRRSSLIGGGSGVLRPGAVSRATGGILFLDEAPEFPRAVLDALRQPLESGRITVHRAAGAAEFPARCQVVLAANPCPCGNAGGAHGQPCECSPSTVRRYLGRHVRAAARPDGHPGARAPGDDGADAATRTAARRRRRSRVRRSRQHEPGWRSDCTGRDGRATPRSPGRGSEPTGASNPGRRRTSTVHSTSGP